VGVVDPPRFRDPLAAGPAGDAPGWHRRLLILGLTGLAAILLGRFFPLSLVSNGICLLVHELGHTAVSIFFGSFAVPAVILTLTFEQTLLSVLGVWFLLLLLLWNVRSDARFAVPLGLLCAVYPFVARSALHVSLITLAGHGAEIACSAFFLHRAGAADLEREWERPGWALLGWLLAVQNAGRAWGLWTSEDARTVYETVSFVGDNDFVRIAKSSGVPLEKIGGLYFFAAVVFPVTALLLVLLRTRRERDAVL